MNNIPLEDLTEALNIMRVNKMSEEDLIEYNKTNEQKITEACKKVKCNKCEDIFLVSQFYNGKYPLCKKHRK